MRDDVVYVFFKCTLNNSHVNKVCDIHRLQDGQLAEYRDIVEHHVEDVQSRTGIGRVCPVSNPTTARARVLLLLDHDPAAREPGRLQRARMASLTGNTLAGDTESSSRP